MPIEALPSYRDWLIESQRDLELWDFCDGDLLDGDWRARVRAARGYLDGYAGRLGIHGPYDGMPLSSSDRRVRLLVAERLRQALEVAAALGASHLVAHSPFDCFGHPQVAHAPGDDLFELIAYAHETLAAVLPVADEIGCTLVLEVCYDTNSAPLLALVRSFNSARVRLSLDVGHAFIMQRAGGPPPDQWVRDGGELLAHLHLQDTDGHLDRHWAPGEGNLNWFAIFDALSRLDEHPRLLLELDKLEKIRQGAEWLAARGWVR
jgi:sugar phosphate isomerase/epimerase